MVLKKQASTLNACMPSTKYTALTSQLIVESAPNSIILINSKGEIAFANNQTEKLFGYAKNELTNKAIDILIPERYTRPQADSGHISFGEPTNWILGSGKEFYVNRKDGTTFPAEIGINLLVTPEETLTLVVIIDITERKRNEKQLENSEKRFREFFENAPEAIVIFDIASSTFVKSNTNALTLFSFSNEELRQKGLVEISPELQPGGYRSDTKVKE